MHQEGYGTVIHARLLVIGAPRRMSRCKLIRNTAGSVVGFFFFFSLLLLHGSQATTKQERELSQNQANSGFLKVAHCHF